MGTLNEQIFIWRDFWDFCSFSETVPAFCWKFRGGVVKSACYVSPKTIWGKIVFDKIILFKSFLDIEQKLSHFLTGVFQLSWKNCFLSVYQNFLRKRNKTYNFPIIFGPEQKFFGFCQKHFWQDRQNFFLGGHRNILREKLFRTVPFIPIFFSHPTKSLAFWQTFFERLSKLQSKCKWERLTEQNFIWLDFWDILQL